MEEVRCPYCHSSEVSMYSLFGQRLMTSSYRCHRCSTYFEAVRWKDRKEKTEPEKRMG